MVKKRNKNTRVSCNSKTIYIYDEDLGWINVTIYLDSLKKAINELKRENNYISSDYDLFRPTTKGADRA